MSRIHSFLEIFNRKSLPAKRKNFQWVKKPTDINMLLDYENFLE